MSGIAGIFNCAEGRPAEEGVLQQMLQAIAHRGPDEVGVWTSGPIGLGHCMLWTTPESLLEQQPLSSEDGSLCLTADARVDNRGELRANLLANGARLRTDTDAELILWSYEIWGESCPAKIIGDFAFAIWDSRLRRLFCARDPIGIKPFYYHFDGKAFRWGSAPQALFGDGTITPQPNLKLISQSLLNRFDNREETLHKDILRLPPAHSLVVEGDRIRKARYWELDPGHTVRYRTDEEYAEHFLEIFREAVAARLRSHGPIGAMLSGGLDSSSVVCVAQDILREKSRHWVPLEAMSIVFDNMPCDERSYIEAVAQKCDVRVNQFCHDANASWLDFEQTEKYGNCCYSPTLFMIGPALELAQRKNIRTVLTGIGGDDLTASSMVHLTDFARQRRIANLYRQLKDDAEFASCSRWPLFRDYCVRPLIPQRARAALRSLVKPFRKASTPIWLTSECLRNAGTSDMSNGAIKTRFPTAAQQRIHDRLEHGWNTNVALGRVDAFTSEFALECRHPFFDRRLVEFMVAVPEEQRWFGPWQKTVLRRAMAGILPESVRCRMTKAEFSSVVDREFKERQADKAEQLMHAPVLRDLGLIHVEEFREFYERYRHGPVSIRVKKACQNVIGLELWCRSATRPTQN